MARKSEEPDPPNMTPMIDIVFQIIIFFVFTADLDQAKFDKKAQLAFAPDTAEVTDMDPRTIHIDVNKATEVNGIVKVGSSPLALADLPGVLNAARLRAGNDTPVVIRAERDLKHKVIKDVMNMATGVGLWRIEIAAIKEKVT